jgi:hypothetical protein
MATPSVSFYNVPHANCKIHLDFFYRKHIAPAIRFRASLPARRPAGTTLKLPITWKSTARHAPSGASLRQRGPAGQ